MKKPGKFLYEIVYSDIRNKIEGGVYEPGSLLPSEKELSAQHEVDRITVRTALKKLVEEGMVEKRPGVGTRVIYGYSGVPDGQESLKKNVIGFFLMENELPNRGSSQPYYADLFYSFEDECARKNCQIMYSALDMNCEYEQLLANNSFMGIVLVSCANDMLIHAAKERDIPLVLVNRQRDESACVTCDHLSGSFLAMRHLYDNGHRDIALIRGVAGHLSDTMKMSGCLCFAHEMGFAIREENVAHGNWEYESGYECARKILLGKARKDLPTAIFSFNDMMAIGAIRAVEELGLRAGEDVSIIGYDNMSQLKYIYPTLSTVDANIGRIARVALQNIISQSSGKPANKGLMLIPVKLAARNTVKNINP